jgi:antitoxin (DNA-binding transcriptional repressor) of toxin-antitoxin stability system
MNPTSENLLVVIGLATAACGDDQQLIVDETPRVLLTRAGVPAELVDRATAGEQITPPGRTLAEVIAANPAEAAAWLESLAVAAVDVTTALSVVAAALAARVVARDGGDDG